MAKKGESTANDSRKISNLVEKVDAVFDECFEKRMTGSFKEVQKTDENGIPQYDENGEPIMIKVEKGWTENTRDTYADMVKAFIRDMNAEYGISRLDKMFEKSEQYFQKRIDNFHSGNLSEAYNLKTLRAAVNAFNQGVERTDVFPETFQLADGHRLTEMLKEQNVVRYSKASTVMSVTPEQAQSVLDNIKNSGYDVKSREMAYHVGKIAMLTGGRVSAILKLKASDFVIDRTKNEIRFIGDKGGKDNVVKIDRETANYLDALRDGKSGKDWIFDTKRTSGEAKGTFKSITEMRKEVTKIITKAGSHLTNEREITVRDKNGKPVQRTVKQKFSTHSFRKSFALSRVAYYLEKFNSTSAIDKYVSRRIDENGKLKGKLDTVRDRINNHRNEDRDLKPHEYAIFFASVDMGHWRNDVITAFYTTYKEVADYMEEKR